MPLKTVQLSKLPLRSAWSHSLGLNTEKEGYDLDSQEFLPTSSAEQIGFQGAWWPC